MDTVHCGSFSGPYRTEANPISERKISETNIQESVASELLSIISYWQD